MSVSDPLEQAIAADTSYVVCLRPFNAVGYESMRGEVLSTEGWPAHRIQTLVDRRFISAYPKGLDVPAPKKVEGVVRMIVDFADVEEATKRPVEEKKPTPTRAKSGTTKKATAKKTTTKKTTKKK
jgi:hypothetical protein